MIFQIDKQEPQIYTTGAFLRPLQIKDANGNEMWVWYVERFEGGDSYNDGDAYHPVEVSSSLEKLLVNKTADSGC